MVFFVGSSISLHQIGSISSDLSGLFHLGIIHGQQLHLLHPSPKAIDHILQIQRLHRHQGKSLLDCLIVDQRDSLSSVIHHQPLALLHLRTAILLPRIFLHPFTPMRATDLIANFETIGHRLELIEEGLLRGVLDKVQCRDLLITRVVELADIHGHLGREATLNTQAEHSDIPALSTLQSLHLLSEFSLPIGRILSIRNEDNGNRRLLRHSHQSLLQFLKSSIDIGHPTSMLLQVLRKDRVLLQFGNVTEGDEKISRLGDTLVPKLGHGRPVAPHTARCVNQPCDDLALLGGSGLDLGDTEEGVGQMRVQLHLSQKQIFYNVMALFLLQIGHERGADKGQKDEGKGEGLIR